MWFSSHFLSFSKSAKGYFSLIFMNPPSPGMAIKPTCKPILERRQLGKLDWIYIRVIFYLHKLTFLQVTISGSKMWWKLFQEYMIHSTGLGSTENKRWSEKYPREFSPSHWWKWKLCTLESKPFILGVSITRPCLMHIQNIFNHSESI